jgi:2'-5' RNA ligase
MPYSIGLYFDPETDRTVREIWRRLAEDGLADYYPVSGNRPHITLVLFEDTDVDRAESVLREVAESQPVFPLSFQQVGVFPGVKPVVFWAPVIAQTLLALQRRLYDRLADFSQEPEFDFYQPDHWIPHCGLAMEIGDRASVPEIVREGLSLPNPHVAKAREIGLISFRPVKEIVTLPLD